MRRRRPRARSRGRPASGPGPSRPGEHLDDRHRRPLADPHGEAREGGRARVAPVDDEQRAASTVTPAGTSTNTGSGVNASFRRTSASPPCCTDPSSRRDSGTSSARPKANPAPFGAAAHGEGAGAPVVHQDAPRRRPQHRPPRPPGAPRRPGPTPVPTPPGAGARTRRGPGRRWASSATPPRSPRGGAVDRKASWPAALRSRSQPGPARPADASALNVCRVKPLSGGCISGANAAHAL